MKQTKKLTRNILSHHSKVQVCLHLYVPVLSQLSIVHPSSNSFGSVTLASILYCTLIYTKHKSWRDRAAGKVLVLTSEVCNPQTNKQNGNKNKKQTKKNKQTKWQAYSYLGDILFPLLRSITSNYLCVIFLYILQVCSEMSTYCLFLIILKQMKTILQLSRTLFHQFNLFS